MKQFILFALALAIGLAAATQNIQVKEGLKFTKANQEKQLSIYPLPQVNPAKDKIESQPEQLKSKSTVSIVGLGTSYSPWGLGYAGGHRAVLDYNAQLNSLAFIHHMGGYLDPGGNANDFGYDLSTDGGQTWTTMIEVFQETDFVGKSREIHTQWPQGGIFNPAGNTNPNGAYVAYQSTVFDFAGSGSFSYLYGRGNIGNPDDTTQNTIYPNPSAGIYVNQAKGFTLTDTGEMWLADINHNPDIFEWLNTLVITRCSWNTAEDDFELTDQFLLDCPGEYAPGDLRIAFSPDGQFGYVAALTDIGTVPISSGQSYYPVIWRSDDGGESWSEAEAVPLAGENGIFGVQYYLNDDELAEIYGLPIPAREEIPFTTAYDFGLTVDAWGNPHIAVIVGISAEPYSILTDISPSSGWMYTGAFLLSSTNLGEPGSWDGGLMGRPTSFHGTFGDFITEDNRIQICRTHDGERVFVSWLDTDTTVSSENNAPDIWSRGVNLAEQLKTGADYQLDLPVNVTFGSEATFSAYFFTMADEAISNIDEYTLPMVYSTMNPNSPPETGSYKYIQDFSFDENDFMFPAYITVGVPEDSFINRNTFTMSAPAPNPASNAASFNIELKEKMIVSVKLLDLLGQTVMELPATEYQSGSSKISLEIDNLSPGLYFLSAQAGRETISRKLMIK